MKIIKDAVCYLNHGQTPVIAMDQPLFAIAKQIQWYLPDNFGEDKYVVMLGGLHVKMLLLKILGEWLHNSGWSNALVQADITTSGRADAICKGSHVTRSRCAQQVTACALFILQKIAYNIYLEVNIEGNSLDFDSWKSELSDKCPMFRNWS